MEFKYLKSMVSFFFSILKPLKRKAVYIVYLCRAVLMFCLSTSKLTHATNVLRQCIFIQVFQVLKGTMKELLYTFLFFFPKRTTILIFFWLQLLLYYWRASAEKSALITFIGKATTLLDYFYLELMWNLLCGFKRKLLLWTPEYILCRNQFIQFFSVTNNDLIILTILGGTSRNITIDE